MDNHFPFFLAIIGASLNFLPHLLGYSLKDPTTNKFPSFLYELSSFQLAASLVASLAIYIPIFIDYILDIASIIIVNSNKVLNEESHLTPLREMIFLLVVPDIFLLWLVPKLDFDTLAGLVAARDTMYMYAVLAYMVRLKNPIWTWKSCMTVFFPLMIDNVLITFKLLLRSSQNASSYVSAVVIIAPILAVFGVLMLTINTIRWFQYVRYTHKFGNSENEDSKVVLCSVCSVLFLLFILGDWCIWPAESTEEESWSSIGSNYLIVYTLLMSGCTLMLTMISTRLSRMEALESKVSPHLIIFK